MSFRWPSGIIFSRLAAWEWLLCGSATWISRWFPPNLDQTGHQLVVCLLDNPSNKMKYCSPLQMQYLLEFLCHVLAEQVGPSISGMGSLNGINSFSACCSKSLFPLLHHHHLLLPLLLRRWRLQFGNRIWTFLHAWSTRLRCGRRKRKISW